MIRKLITLAISLLILGAIYYKIDLSRLAAVLASADFFYLLGSLGMVIPLTLLTAWRLQILAPARVNVDFAEANRLILAASALNMILPSKMGDIAKAYFMKSEKARSPLSLSVVIFEKTADLLSLLFWCVLGLFLYPGKDTLFWATAAALMIGLTAGVSFLTSPRLARFVFASLGRATPAGKKELPGFTGFGDKLRALESGWKEMQEYFWSDKRRVVRISILSIFIWWLHLLQIWFFILALRAFAPFVAALALAPLAILAGLLPFTFAGIGTRDATLIVLFKPYFDAPVAAALGLLCTARYILPAIAGLPFLHRYFERVATAKSGP